jgi:UDP-glucose:(heptosyl)LPS alpha-1,3-glucosyltransferase
MVYNGIDPGRFRFPTPEERSSARARFGIAPSDRVVLFFERRPYKGGATLRRAFAKLPEHRLLVLGGSEAALDLFGTQPRVIASARIADARQAYWAADALAFPSEIEAFGVVLIEALACGLPIAASDIPVVHEICDGVESVFIYPTGDAQALADALERASSCTSIESGRARVIERFSLEGWTRDVLALYDGG